ncbi:PqiC family protein [Paraburkholderia sp. 2C]|jgi:uncharacterized protein
MKRLLLPIVAMLLWMFVCACTNTPRTGHYSLNAQSLRQNTDAGMPLAIVIDDVTIPKLVDRPQFVLRVGQSQVRVDDAARWRVPLKSQIATVIAADLGQLFRDAIVSTSSVSTSSQSTDRLKVRLAINVQKFDSVPGSGTVLVVFWSMLTPGSNRALNGKSVVIEQVDRDGYEALVDAHSRALAAVSEDIATMIASGIRKGSTNI